MFNFLLASLPLDGQSGPLGLALESSSMAVSRPREGELMESAIGLAQTLSVDFSRALVLGSGCYFCPPLRHAD